MKKILTITTSIFVLLTILFASLYTGKCNENLELKYDILAYIVIDEIGNDDFEIIYYKNENKAKVIYTYDGSLKYVWYELQEDRWVVVYE